MSIAGSLTVAALADSKPEEKKGACAKEESVLRTGPDHYPDANLFPGDPGNKGEQHRDSVEVIHITPGSMMYQWPQSIPTNRPIINRAPEGPLHGSSQVLPDRAPLCDMGHMQLAVVGIVTIFGLCAWGVFATRKKRSG